MAASNNIIKRLLKSFNFGGYGGQSGTSYASTLPYFTTLGLGTYANSNVDYQQAAGDPLQSSLVMAAVTWLSRTLPEAPIRVGVIDSKGQRQLEPGHAVSQLLRQPNPYYAGTTMLAGFAASWILDGNAYFYKVRNNAGKVIQLLYLPHFLVEPRWSTSGQDFIGWYEYRVDGQVQRLDVADVIHFRNGLNPANTRKGISPLASVLREIYSDNEAASYAAAILRNQGVPGLVISPALPPQSADPDVAEFLKREILNRTTGDDRGKPLVALMPTKIEQFGFDPKSMNVTQLRRLPEERIAAALGIPAVVLGYGAGLDRSIYNNVKEAREAAYESYLIPLQRIISETLATHLLTEFDQRPGAYVEFDNSAVRVLQEDQDALAGRLVALYEGGLIRRGEARAQLGLEATPDDDLYYTDMLPAKPAPASLEAQPHDGGPAAGGGSGKAINITVEGKPINAGQLTDSVVEAINNGHRRGFIA
jgi:HK97 family phage portal protein